MLDNKRNAYRLRGWRFLIDKKQRWDAFVGGKTSCGHGCHRQDAVRRWSIKLVQNAIASRMDERRDHVNHSRTAQ